MSDRPIVIKNPPEIETMREAGRVNAAVLDMMHEMIRPGISTEELDASAEDFILKKGGKPAFKNYPGPYPYPATLTISINEELVHGIPGKRKLLEGDIVSVDCGTILDGQETLEEAGERIFEEIMATASGKMTASERLGYGDEEFAPWDMGVML